MQALSSFEFLRTATLRVAWSFGNHNSG